MRPWTDCSPPGSSVSGDSPSKNTRVGCHALLQGIFPTHALNPGLLYCRQILYCLSHQESPRILEWVAYPFSRGTSWSRNQIRVFGIAGGFFTSWSTREALLMDVTGEQKLLNPYSLPPLLLTSWGVFILEQRFPTFLLPVLLNKALTSSFLVLPQSVERIMDLVSDQLTVRLWTSCLGNDDMALLSYYKTYARSCLGMAFIVRAQERLNSILFLRLRRETA